MSDVLIELVKERMRQIEMGFTPEHDDRHTEGQLAQAAACYALGSRITVFGNNLLARGLWPWDEEGWHPEDQRRNLVKAAALILAEIERMDRLEALVGEDRQGD